MGSGLASDLRGGRPSQTSRVPGSASAYMRRRRASREKNWSVGTLPRAMTIQVTGKNLDVGEALRGYVQERVSQTVEKYIGRTPSGHVRVEKEHGEFRTDCTIHLWQGMSS